MFNFSKFSVIVGDTMSKEKTPFNIFKLNDILNYIKYPNHKYAKLIHEIGNSQCDKKRKELKKQLPGILYNLNKSTWKSSESIFNLYKSNKDCINPLIMLDIDKADIQYFQPMSIEELKLDLMQKLHYSVTGFISPSGNGLKILCYLNPLHIRITPLDIYNQVIKGVYNQIESDCNLTNRYKIKLDSSCINITKSHYLSYDPNIIIKKEDDIIPLNIKEFVINTVSSKLNRKTVAESPEIKLNVIENNSLDETSLFLAEALVLMMPIDFLEVNTKFNKLNSHLARLTFTWGLLYLTNMSCYDTIMVKYSDKQAGIKSFSVDKWQKSKHTTWLTMTDIASSQENPSFLRAFKMFKDHHHLL